LAYRACAKGAKDGPGNLKGTIAIFDDLVDEMIWSACGWKEDDQTLFFTGKRNFRKEIFPSYKANRKGPKPEFLADVTKHAVDHWNTVVCQGYEADDGICMAAYERGLDNVVIVSADKDFRQIPCEIFSTYSLTTVHPTEEEADYNFWKQALTGDSVDNIKGIPGIGPKKAEAILVNDDVSWATAVIEAYEAYQEENEDTDVNLDDTLLQIRLLRNLKEYEEIRSKYSLS
jgi:DNA polymerase-1